MRVRPACPADLDDVFILYRLAMEEVSNNLGGYPLQTGSSAWRSSYDALKEWIDEMGRNGNVMIVVAEDKVVVGFAMASVVTLAPPHAPLVIGKSVYTYLLPQYRGGGTAKEMMLAKIDWCKSKGADCIEAYTTTKNRARILMERGGYKQIGYELRKLI